MRNEIRQVELAGGQPQLAGAVVGAHLFDGKIAPALVNATPETILLLSFRGAEFVTGSVFKASWHRLRTVQPLAPPAVVAHLADDVRTEFAIYLRSERLAGLEATDWRKDAVVRAKLHGHIEESAFDALMALIGAPGSTAPELLARFGGGVSATAWTNRLNDLHAQGLALREKAGRAWRFFPIAKEIHRG